MLWHTFLGLYAQGVGCSTAMRAEKKGVPEQKKL